MDTDRQKYLVSRVVGQPRLLILGQQVRIADDIHGLDFGMHKQGWRSRLRHFIDHLIMLALSPFPRILKTASANNSQEPQHNKSSANPLERGEDGLVSSSIASKPGVRIGMAAGTIALASWALFALVGQWRQEITDVSNKPLEVAAPVTLPVAQPGTSPTPTVESALPITPAAASGPLPSSGIESVNADAATPQPPVTAMPSPTPTPRPGEPLPGMSSRQESSPTLPSRPTQSVVKKDRDDERPPAVILDKAPLEITPASAQPPVSQPKATDAAPAPTTRKFADPIEVTSGAPASKPSADTKKRNAERITVVDIAPDGNYVLITNPATRLPQKYQAGQKIFTGETLKSIDPANSKIVLDTRTVNME